MKEEYEQRLQAQIDEWKADIDKLRAKAEKAKADTRIEYMEQLDRLKTKRRDMEVKLNELKQQSDTAWDEMRGGIDSAWSDLSEAFKRARSKFN